MKSNLRRAGSARMSVSVVPESSRLLRVNMRGITLVIESNLAFYGQRLEEFKSRLTGNYPETRGRHSWQQWMYDNTWLFGTQHLTPIPKEKVGFANVPDFLFPTLDGFVDILEIKSPACEVIVADRSHRGSWAWSGETSRAIGQVVNYIQEMELNQLQLMKRINEQYGDRYGILNTLKPRAFILTGSSNGWNEGKRQALRGLGYSLHGIQILTYSDLLRNGERIVSLLGCNRPVL